jgi:hypothetical protein
MADLCRVVILQVSVRSLAAALGNAGREGGIVDAEWPQSPHEHPRPVPAIHKPAFHQARRSQISKKEPANDH